MFGINQLSQVPRPSFGGAEFEWLYEEHSYGWLGAVGLSHTQAQAMIASAFVSQLGRAPQGSEALFAQAVSLCESGYGASWKNEGVGSNNMGAVQAGKPPCDPATSFPYGDTHADGQAYAACFRKYATPQEGFNGFIRVLYKQRPKVLAIARAGTIAEFSGTLRESGYFELPLEKHITALTKCLNTVSSATGQPMPAAGRTPATATDWLGMAAVVGVAGWIFWKVVK